MKKDAMYATCTLKCNYSILFTFHGYIRVDVPSSNKLILEEKIDTYNEEITSDKDGWRKKGSSMDGFLPISNGRK